MERCQRVARRGITDDQRSRKDQNDMSGRSGRRGMNGQKDKKGQGGVNVMRKVALKGTNTMIRIVGTNPIMNRGVKMGHLKNEVARRVTRSVVCHLHPR